ncbi:MAG: COX15/CtaA family protein [Bacilli bacterium]
MNKLYRYLKIIALLSNIWMIAVLLGGALVTKTGSGQGCGPNWPLCHGALVPDSLPVETVIELSHRITSFSAGVCVLIFAIMAWRIIGHHRETKMLAIISVGFLVFQALLGAAAVIWAQSASILALHFGISLISFAAVFILMMLVFEVDKKLQFSHIVFTPFLKKGTIGLAVYSLIVVYSGALVRHTKSSLACSSVPFCEPSSILGENSFEWVQMAHRMFASLIFVFALILFLHVRKHYKIERNFKALYFTVLLLTITQGISGALIVYSKLSLLIALFHAFNVSIMFALICYIVLLLLRKVK